MVLSVRQARGSLRKGMALCQASCYDTFVPCHSHPTAPHFLSPDVIILALARNYSPNRYSCARSAAACAVTSSLPSAASALSNSNACFLAALSPASNLSPNTHTQTQTHNNNAG